MERRILTEIVKLRGSRSTNAQQMISDVPLPLSSVDDLNSMNQKMADEAVFDALVRNVLTFVNVLFYGVNILLKLTYKFVMTTN